MRQTTAANLGMGIIMALDHERHLATDIRSVAFPILQNKHPALLCP